MQGATDTHEGGHTRNRETLEQVEKDVEDEDDEETEEVEEVVRADSPVRHDDPTALRLFQAVTEACETASNANNDVAKAYGALTWKNDASIPGVPLLYHRNDALRPPGK
ncbi:hypothetical protein F5883DRAFT_652662 [Diaporthe sp. PMI_573]|nr:hypothetical protein F5883DRAFT_652662 [Diaporthaceae sp. PMI_573]